MEVLQLNDVYILLSLFQVQMILPEIIIALIKVIKALLFIGVGFFSLN